MKAVLVVCVSVLAGFAASAAQATIVIYSSWATFSAAVPTATTHDFSGLAIPAVPGFLVGPQTLFEVKFDSIKIPFLLDGRYYGGAQIFSGQSPDAEPSNVVISLMGSTYAFGLTYGAYNATPGTPVTITLSDGSEYLQNLPANSGVDTNFFGFVSSTPVTGLTLATIANMPNPPPYAYSLDVVSFVTAVPEPATWGLLVAGIGLTGMAARRRGCQGADRQCARAFVVCGI